MKKATSSKSYLGLLTGLLIGGIQHYMMTNSKTNSKKPIAKVIDRKLNHR